MKQCRKCLEVKDLELFCYLKAQNLYLNLCKKCKSEYDKEYSKTHRKEIRENVKNRHKKDPAKRKKYEKERRIKNIWHHLWRKAKIRAKRKKLEFLIKKEDVENLAKDICPILDAKFDLNDKTKQNLPSLDRIDNNIGYIKNNIEIISYRANSIKKNGNLEDFEKILDFYKNKINLYIPTETTNKELKIRGRRLLNVAKGTHTNILYDLDKLKKTELCKKIPDKCPVFGLEFCVNKIIRSDNSLSIDRIDNSKGYELDNIVFVSWKANSLKSDATIEELEKLVLFLRKIKNL